MSETKWTAAPWAPGHMVNQDHSCECRYILSDGAGYFGSVAVVSKNNGLRVGEGGNDCPPEEEAIANAHLIAAAPELYEALHVSLDALIWASGSQDFGEGGIAREGFLKLHKPAIDKAFEVLAKARGEVK